LTEHSVERIIDALDIGAGHCAEPQDAVRYAGGVLRNWSGRPPHRGARTHMARGEISSELKP
jgi:hypothetical protein